MVARIEAVSALPDPVGRELARWRRPNGLEIARVSTPIGVIGMIYESRPDVTAEAAAICVKSGNAVILRGGSYGRASSAAIHAAIVENLPNFGISRDTVQLVATADRAAVDLMLGGLYDSIDVLIPRGGQHLVARVKKEARVAVLAHLEGVCHVFVHGDADLQKARKIVLNSKMRRTGICGAAESLLIDCAVLESHGVAILSDLQSAGCEIRADEHVRAIFPSAKQATEKDWSTEYLAGIISVKTVNGLESAIRHIECYGSNHTESIVTESPDVADRFLSAVDSAIVLWNASTQFADGYEFGMGGEMGIGTGKLHARGPVSAEQLTSFKYVVRGDGQIRP